MGFFTSEQWLCLMLPPAGLWTQSQGCTGGSVCSPNPGCSKEVGSVGHEEAPSFYLPGWLLLVISTWWETRVLGKNKQTIRTRRDYQVKPLYIFSTNVVPPLLSARLFLVFAAARGSILVCQAWGLESPCQHLPGCTVKCRLPGPTPELLSQNIWEGGGTCIFSYLRFEKNWGSDDTGIRL